MKENDNKIDVELYQPHKFQKLIHHYCSDAHPSTFCVGVAGRQSGKSYSALYQCVYWALNNTNCRIMWCSPSLGQAQYVFLNLLTELTNAGLVVKKNQGISSMFIELINGTIIYVRAANSENSLRGYTIQKLIVDECAYVDERVYREVLLPMLNTQKPGVKNKILLISTPRGKLNWLYSEFSKIGKDPAYAGCKWTSFDNPARNEQIILDFKKTLSEASFNQEFMAAWQDQYSLFNNVIDCASIPNLQTEPIPNERYIMAFDLAASIGGDYNACTIINYKGQIVYIERFRRVTNAGVKQRIADLIKQWQPAKIIMEKTGVGRPIISDLKTEFNIYNIEEFETTQSSKEQIVESLANSFDNFSIRIPKNPDYLIKELIDFTAFPLKSGKMRYESATGKDDAVMSLCLAWYGYKKYAKSSGRYIVK